MLRNVAGARPDPVINAALDTLESSATPDVGVEPLSDLASWYFTSVSPKVESVSLVPDQGAGVLSHVASAVLSKLRFKPRGLPEGNDVLSVLARAEYHLNEKDLDTAARELNQLTGWSKLLLKDWLDAARARLEVQQALEVRSTFSPPPLFRGLTDMNLNRSFKPKPPWHPSLYSKLSNCGPFRLNLSPGLPTTIQSFQDS